MRGFPLTTLAFLFGTILLLDLSGCGGGGSDSEAPSVFIFARGSDAEKLDPADIDDGESVNTLAQVCEGLVRFRPGTLEVEPWLAESWDVSDDGLVWTFQIREGVRFHDGTPLTAEAAHFSFARQMDPEHPAHLPEANFPYWTYLYQDVASAEVTAPMELTFTLSQPNASFLYSMATFPVWLISPLSYETHGSEMQRHPIGTGPWVFQEWRVNEAVLYQRNDDYWAGIASDFPRLVMRVIPENTVRLLELEAGDIHGLTGLQPAEVEGLVADPRFTVHRDSGMNVGYLAISDFSERLRDPEIRRAMAMAIDRQALVDLVLDGMGSVAEYPMPPGFLGEPQGEPPLVFDPEAASAIMEAYPDFRDTPIVLATTSAPRDYFPDPVKIASLIRSDLEAVGFDVEIVTRDWKSHLNTMRNGDFDIGLLGWNGDNGDTDNFLSVFFGSWAAVKGSANNVSFYRNPAMDDFLLVARAEVNAEARGLLYEQALKLWARDLPLIPLVHADHIVVMRQEVTGFQVLKNTNIVLKGIGWEAPIAQP